MKWLYLTWVSLMLASQTVHAQKPFQENMYNAPRDVVFQVVAQSLDLFGCNDPYVLTEFFEPIYTMEQFQGPWWADAVIFFGRELLLYQDLDFLDYDGAISLAFESCGPATCMMRKYGYAQLVRPSHLGRLNEGMCGLVMDDTSKMICIETEGSDQIQQIVLYHRELF